MPPSPIHPRRLALGGLLSLAVAMGIGRFVYTPILPVMAEALGHPPAVMGAIASANFLGYLLGALAAAFAPPRGSRRTWLLAALLASGATTGLMALAGDPLPASGLRFLGGAASAFVLVFASTLVLDRLQAAGAGGLSALHFAGVGAGIALSAVLVAGLAAAGASWSALWIAAGALSLLGVPLVASLVPAEEASPLPRPAPSAGRAGSGLAALILAYGLFGFGYSVTATFLVAIVRGSAEVRALEPVVWLVVGLAGAPSVALWSLLGRRVGATRAFAAACLVEAVGVTASVLWTSAAGVLLAAVALGGTFMAITALGLVAARTLSAGDPRRVVGLMTAAFGLGQILGPLLGGVLAGRTGDYVAASLAAVGALVVAAGLSHRIGARTAD